MVKLRCLKAICKFDAAFLKLVSTPIEAKKGIFPEYFICISAESLFLTHYTPVAKLVLFCKLLSDH